MIGLTAASIVILHLSVTVGWAHFVLPPLNDKLFVEEGELNIGVILSITAYAPDRPCGDKIDKFYQVEIVEMIKYAVNIVNMMLPIKLGFIIADACEKETVAAMQALRFLPYTDLATRNDSSKLFDHMFDHELDHKRDHIPGLVQNFQVIGVVGTDQSFTSRPVASVLNAGGVPMVSFWATDVKLGDEKLYPNFFRVIGTDEDILRAIVHFIFEHHYCYFTILYEDALPVMSMFESILTEYETEKLCHPHEFKVTQDDDFNAILRELLADNYTSRLVIVLAHDVISTLIVQAVMRSKIEEDLLWIGGDSWTQVMFFKGGPKGSLGVTFQVNPMTEFDEHFRTLDSKSRNPWFMQGMKDYFNCTEDECIRETLKDYKQELLLYFVYKAVMTYGVALLDFFQIFCPEDDEDQNFVECFRLNAKNFPAFIRNASRPTEAQDGRPALCSLYQSAGHRGRINLLEDIDVRDHKSEKYAAINTSDFDFDAGMLDPRAFCMPQCAFGEYRNFISKCCWECVPCEVNEIVNDRKTDCQNCPLLQWPQPDDENRGVCIEISPLYMDVSFYFPHFLFTVAVFGMSGVVWTVSWYKRNRDNEIVKASSIELSCVQLVTFFMGYLAVPVLLTRPTDWNCSVGVLLCTVSFNISYVIMLIKAVRVYRIFNLSKKNMRIAYTGQVFQMITCLVYFIFEVCRFMITNYFYPVRSEIFQPLVYVRYTEITCTIPAVHMFLFFVLDFTLLLMCCVLAFKTQTLPTKFKESKYVSMCVITTLVIWSGLMPAYFTATYRQVRILMLTAATVINHTTAYVFLFLTRILAVESIKRARRRAVMHTARYQKRHQGTFSMRRTDTGRRSEATSGNRSVNVSKSS
ncbi:hypothetical protein Btru_052731 [Bulinus truncatus]|nr:hypothetical protein Btru_052731 [Bulinus truncatus]